MTLDIFQSLLPVIIPSVVGIAILLLGALHASRQVLFALSLLALFVGGITLIQIDTSMPWVIHRFITIDRFGCFMMAILYATTFIVLLLNKQLIDDSDSLPEVYYAVTLFALTGMGIVCWTNNLAAFFLGLEIYTACLIILIAYHRKRSISLEAAIKYLIMGGVSSGFILLGIGFLYFGFGSLELTKIAGALQATSTVSEQGLWWVGASLLIAGACFKLSLVPFHMWAPDVYQGAPSLVAAFIATASKTAILAILIRFLVLFGPITDFAQLLEIVVIASLIIGNLLALYQKNLKRLLAYSSIANIGYAALPLCIGGDNAWPSTLIYLITYIVAVLAAFGFIVAEEGDAAECGDLDHYRGLGHERPFQAAGMAIAFFSLAGIPLTAGFIGKWSVLTIGLAGQKTWLIVAFIFGAAIGAFYYLRVIGIIYFATPQRAFPTQNFSPTLLAGIILSVLGILVIGLYPEPLFQQVAAATQEFLRESAGSLIISKGASCCH